MMKELVIEAEKNNLSEVLEFVGKELDEIDCSIKARMQIEVAVEEMFVNIASYAYTPKSGMATVQIKTDPEDRRVDIILIDSGTPFNPVEREDPDVSLSAEERKIGGLGIYMTKKGMDSVEYEYKDSKNILTMVKWV